MVTWSYPHIGSRWEVELGLGVYVVFVYSNSKRFASKSQLGQLQTSYFDGSQSTGVLGSIFRAVCP